MTSRSSRASTTLFDKRIGNDDQVVGRHRLQRDRAARKDLIVLVGGELDQDGFFLAVDRADQARLQAAQNFVFFGRGEPHEDRDAIAEQRHKAFGAKFVGQRRSRDDAVVLKVRRVDAVAQEERSYPSPGLALAGCRPWQVSLSA